MNVLLRRVSGFARTLLMVAAVASASAADDDESGEAAVPLALENLRAKYEAALTAQIEDLRSRYVVELNALRATFRSAGREDAVALVDREIRDLERERDAVRRLLAEHVWGERPALAAVAVDYGGRLRVIGLEQGTPYVLDRDYRITEVPDGMSGLAFTSLKAHEMLTMRVTVTRAGRLWLLLDPKSYEEDARRLESDGGWRRMDPVKTDDTMGAFLVLRRDVREGERLTFEPREWLSVGLAAGEIAVTGAK